MIILPSYNLRSTDILKAVKHVTIMLELDHVSYCMDTFNFSYIFTMVYTYAISTTRSFS